MSADEPPGRNSQPPPLRLVQVGAGVMGRIWLQTIADSPDTELVGLVDLDEDAAAAAVGSLGLAGVPVSASLAELIDRLGPDAVVDVTVPAAHNEVNLTALAAGLPVLCEKPISPTVAEALIAVAAAETSGRLLMISQSRRYFTTFHQVHDLARRLGRIGAVTCDFFLAPHFGGFRDQMAQPLLVDMAIHQFDAARHLIGREPVAVYCETYNPAWSWYAGDAAATAIFEFEGGTRFTYTGSWCSPGHETSWNGSWRVSAAEGTVLWDGDHEPAVDAPGQRVRTTQPPAAPEQVAGSLAEFVTALRTGSTPAGEAHRNLPSLAMVEAAVTAARHRQRVALADVVTTAYAEALGADLRDDVRATLLGWSDVLETVGLHGGV